MKNWKTTVAGLLVFIAGGVSALWPQYAQTVNLVLALLAGTGLIAAKDARE